MKRNRSPLFFLSFVFFLLTAQAPSPPPTWVADLTLTLLSPYHVPITARGTFYQNGSMIRYEPAGSEEIDLYDLKQMEELRLFPADRIYFRARLGPARILKAVREGWMPAPAPLAEKRILLKEGTIKEREARLYFIILEEKGGKWYSLRWVTADPAEFPLRTIYPASDSETVIADYDSLRTEPSDPARFEPPADFLSVNPF
jgi:hypothetical protein